MNWCAQLLILITLQFVSSHYEVSPGLTFKLMGPGDFSENHELSAGRDKMNVLEALLLSSLNSKSPFLYFDDHPLINPEANLYGLEGYLETTKRSRYLRRQYPWKRQNSIYDFPTGYFCKPSKDEVFRLLIALQEARQGNTGRIINFCNRRRPASNIFQNIRVLR